VHYGVKILFTRGVSCFIFRSLRRAFILSWFWGRGHIGEEGSGRVVLWSGWKEYLDYPGCARLFRGGGILHAPPLYVYTSGS
jgi:hypothetical protein